MHRLRRQRLIGRIWRKLCAIFRIIKNVMLLLILFTFVAYAIVAGWLYWEISRVPELQQDTVFVLNLEGMIWDCPSGDPVADRFVGNAGKTRRQIIENIRKAAQDPRITGLLLTFKGYGMDRSTAFEIQDALLRFKESGKKIFAFMESAGLRTYLLASVADQIYMPPSGTTYMLGLRAEIPFFREMLDTVGVTPEFIAIGKYKTAPQVFTMDHLSDEYREVMTDILDMLYAEYTERIATARNVGADRVASWIDDGLYPASDALDAGMIDALLYKKQLDRTIQRELGLVDESEEDEAQADDEEAESNDQEEPKLRTINNAQYSRIKVHVPRLYRKGKKIALIYAQGSIMSGRSAPPSSGSPSIGADSMTELFDKLAKDDEIQGIILRVDSGGGGVRASDLIRHSIEEAKKKKPIVVSMVDAAASGGYMISAPADRIVAYPTTITGSIGIFGGKFSMQGLFDFARIHIETMQRGENAGMFSPAELWTESERERYRHHIQQGYDSFLACVAEGRDTTTEAVHQIAQGRVWSGQQALELGLVDQLGDMDTAIDAMKELLELSEGDAIQLVEYPEAESPFRQILDQIRRTWIATRLPAEVLRLQAHLAEIAHLQDETLFAWFPCQVVVDE